MQARSVARSLRSAVMAPAASLAAARSLTAALSSSTIARPSSDKSNSLRSVRAISGRTSGFAQRLVSQSKGSVIRVRCEATATEKEAPVEKYEYQAEVSRLLDLIVHSLYSHKEVFLRELVSNASDALDKLRFLSVTDPSLMDLNPNLEIRIKTDPDAGTITIIDTGIGMTREELIESLGTIAQSGTAKFMQALKDSKENNAADSNLIGQFGVGFYSAFLVADKVTVSTKSAKSDKQYVWEGEADTSVYTICEETDSDKLLPRGTVITLHLKADDKFEYAEAGRIQNLVKNYSQFISFPIYTWQEKSRTKEVEEEADEVKEGAEEDKKEACVYKKKKSITEKYWDWELSNDTKPIWMRNPKEVTKEEYSAFCKSTFKEFIDPQAYTHFTTEGEIEFRSLLFIPGMAPFNTEDMLGAKTKNIRLYVKRVFISDEFDGELFPRYLGFIKGVVDSNDLPLNVSREILQESRIVRIMKRRLVRKTFDMIDEIANRENKEDYKTFWTSFGKNLKLGCIEDSGNHKRLAPLLRFHSNKHEEDLISLDQYVEGMKPDQKAIYYLAADTIKSAKSAPFLEELVKRDLEVLFLVEPVDEVALTNLKEFKDKKFVDISREDLELGGAEDEEKGKEMEKEYKELCDWMKRNLGDKVAKVQISKRISSSPCVLVSGKFGWSANMERIMKAQTLGDSSHMDFMRGQRILEINPNHPIVQDLNRTSKVAPQSSQSQKMLDLLYETALLSSGYTPESPAEFGAKVYEMMSLALAGKSESTAGEPSTSQAEVVEASEVITENDPWKS
ncbi:unnamed protein product [Sphagnum jensenii]|uniref:Histidine kinase/HSP90-like ATPase domain-containing protein n=1 Tax=Sphagnum jensenii TaxID=128206 RepID=A0ABP0WRH5_9BRYO